MGRGMALEWIGQLYLCVCVCEGGREGNNNC